MSHPRYITLLAHYQPMGTHGASIPRDVADQLVRRLAAERISQKVIRLLSPDSKILKALPPLFTQYIPEKLGPGEVAGVKFVAPPSRNSGIPRVCRLPRYREVFGAEQIARSV